MLNLPTFHQKFQGPKMEVEHLVDFMVNGVKYIIHGSNCRLVVLVVGLDSWDLLMNRIVTARVPQEFQTTIYH